MALVDFLYRCPFCGRDPMEGKGLRASCAGCGRGYAPGSGGTRIRITEAGGTESEVTAGELARLLAEKGGATASARGPDGRVAYRSRVRARFADREAPVRFRGELLGFCELFGEVVEGVLALEEGHLRFQPTEVPKAGESGPDGGSSAWPLLELGALQTSSSSVQISPREGGVVLFRFPDASTRRWEELLRTAIAETWRDAGRGEVVEFQPRIRTA